MLAAVREGNPGHRAWRDPVVLAPSALREPDWVELLPGDSADQKRARQVAAELWARTAPVLARSVGLVNAQQDTLVDYCITRARIDQGERALSYGGVVIGSGRRDRGPVKSPWTTVLNHYRPHARSLASELGLTPSSVGRIERPAVVGGDDQNDPFD